MTDQITIGILGAGGRMGATLIDQVSHAPDLKLLAAIDRADHPLMGRPVGPVLLGSEAQQAFQADVVIDFSAPGATASHARIAGNSKTPLVIGTTGLSPEDDSAIDAAAKQTAIVQAGNFSTGVALVMAAVKLLSGRLAGDDWDIEILDRHHKDKVDSPSGTALMLGQAAAMGRGTRLDDVKTQAYQGLHGPRQKGAIAFAAQRGGAVIGDHEVTFFGPHERISLSHHAEDRGLFAAGAVRAARFAVTAAPGRYGIEDVLDL